MPRKNKRLVIMKFAKGFTTVIIIPSMVPATTSVFRSSRRVPGTNCVVSQSPAMPAITPVIRVRTIHTGYQTLESKSTPKTRRGLVSSLPKELPFSEVLVVGYGESVRLIADMENEVLHGLRKGFEEYGFWLARKK